MSADRHEPISDRAYQAEQRIFEHPKGDTEFIRGQLADLRSHERPETFREDLARLSKDLKIAGYLPHLEIVPDQKQGFVIRPEHGAQKERRAGDPAQPVHGKEKGDSHSGREAHEVQRGHQPHDGHSGRHPRHSHYHHHRHHHKHHHRYRRHHHHRDDSHSTGDGSHAADQAPVTDKSPDAIDHEKVAQGERLSPSADAIKRQLTPELAERFKKAGLETDGDKIHANLSKAIASDTIPASALKGRKDGEFPILDGYVAVGAIKPAERDAVLLEQKRLAGEGKKLTVGEVMHQMFAKDADKLQQIDAADALLTKLQPKK